MEEEPSEGEEWILSYFLTLESAGCRKSFAVVFQFRERDEVRRDESMINLPRSSKK